MATRLNHVRSRWGQDGAVALEFGLIFGFVLVPLLLGIVSYGWYFYVAQTTGAATSHVARRLTVGDCWAGTAAEDYVKGAVASNATTTTFAKSPASNSGAVIGTTQLTVTVTADGDLIGLFPMPNGGTVTRTVTTMIEDTTDSGSPC